MSMNLRHTAALALVGWYLMLPPIKENKAACVPLQVVDAPLNEWEISQSF